MRKQDINKKVNELSHKDTTSDTSVTPEESETTQSTLAIQQNNYHFVQAIDIKALTALADKHPELADRVLSIYENQFEHAKNVDNQLLPMEKAEQELRISETPYVRKFAFRGQLFAIFTTVSGIGGAVVFALLDMPTVAGVCITVSLGTVAIQFLGRNK